MKTKIAVNAGGGYSSGLNAVAAGAVLSANEIGWEVVVIRDGYDGLLFPENYRSGGVVSQSPSSVQEMLVSEIFSRGRTDPFNIRAVVDGSIEELDRSDELLRLIAAENVAALISVVDHQAMSIAWKLQRKGLATVCVSSSVENDIAGTVASVGFDSAVGFTVELLARMRHYANQTGRVAVVEVMGRHSGWLALHAGIATLADAVLIPEIPFAFDRIAERLAKGNASQRPPALIVVAEGAQSIADDAPRVDLDEALENTRRALSPGSTSEGTDRGRYVISRSGFAAEFVSRELRRRTDFEFFPFVFGDLLRAGRISPVDRRLGLAYGAAAVRGISDGHAGTMVAFEPPNISFVPIGDCINRVSVVTQDCELAVTARSLGISFGD